MTIDKQALREEFRYMQDHYSDPADRERQEIYIAAEALLDENIQLQREKDAIEAVALVLRDDMRQAREQLAAAERRNAELDKRLIEYAGIATREARRVAELEARKVNLSKLSVGEVMHMSGFSRDYAEGWCAGNDNAIHEIR
ncbi:ead/Ea22-like family protein, partial [Salmonella enterica subsp. enterica serovar Muenchen]|nr:ead/Ea22-like family protein [Salmonella enterica subsp. enterica serovar Muenchen]